MPAQRYYACQVQNLGPGTLYICANLADAYQTPDYYEALIDGSDTAVYTLFGARIKNVYFKSFSTSTIRFGWASAVAGQPPVGVIKDLFDVADFEPIPFSRGEGTGAAVWGSITGNLQDQADLESVLVSLAPLNNPVFTGMATTPALRVTTGAASGNVLTDIDGLGTAAWLPGGGGPGAAVWGSITGTLSDQTDLAMALAAKEPAITSGTTAQYWRGDKTWQTLNASAVGLGNVLNQTQITGATNSTLTQTGTTLSINLANMNTWTTMQTFSGGLTGVLTGTATGNMPLVDPGNAGNVLTSTGSAWISAAPTVYVPLTLTAPSASTTPLTVRGASGQTANLTEWQDSTGAVLASVSPAGAVAALSIFGGSTGKMALTPDVADGASALAFKFDTLNTLATPGAIHSQWLNNGTVLMTLGKAGELNLGGLGDVGLLRSGVGLLNVTDGGSGFGSLTALGLSSTNLTVDTNTIYVDSVNHRVGIGTSPSAKLEVDTGAAGTIGVVVKGASGQTADLQQWQDNTGAVRARCDNSGNWTLQGSMIVGAHEATGLVAQVPNLIYGTGSPPSVGSYAEGTLFIQYSP